MGAFVVILLVAWVALVFFTQAQARKRISFHTSQGRAAIQQNVDEVFGKTWQRVNGRGYINVKPKLRGRAPTISVDVAPSVGGGNEVDIWMSAFTTRYGLVVHGQLVWRKKRQLQTQLSGTSGAAASRTPTNPTGSQNNSSVQAPKTTSATGSVGGSHVTSTVTANSAPINAQICKVVSESSCSFVVRTKMSPRDIAKSVERSLGGAQKGSINHLLLGPPRATMWAHIFEGSNGNNLLVISLVTVENPDQDFVAKSVGVPLQERVIPDLEGTMETSSGGQLGGLENEILRSRLVPVSEYV